jgi:hypothetical protein
MSTSFHQKKAAKANTGITEPSGLPFADGSEIAVEYRFISRDQLSGAEFSQGTNLYAYCANNYINLSDSSGMGNLIGTGSNAAFAGMRNAPPDGAQMLMASAGDILEAVPLEVEGDADTMMAGLTGAIGDIGTQLPSPTTITTSATSAATAASGLPPPEGPIAAGAITDLGQAASTISSIGPAAEADSSTWKSDANAAYGEADSLLSDASSMWSQHGKS